MIKKVLPGLPLKKKNSFGGNCGLTDACFYGSGLTLLIKATVKHRSKAAASLQDRNVYGSVKRPEMLACARLANSWLASRVAPRASQAVHSLPRRREPIVKVAKPVYFQKAFFFSWLTAVRVRSLKKRSRDNKQSVCFHLFQLKRLHCAI